MKKYCTKCGREFEAVGREVICPDCKAQAAEDAKKAAVLKAKKASWNGESVPVRITGRASTVIRRYGAEKSLSFAQALDELLKSTDWFKGMNIKWEDVEPYKSRRCDKHTPQDVQDVPQDVQDKSVKPVNTASKPQEVKHISPSKPVVQAARGTVKATAKKATSKASKAVKKEVKA